MTTSKTTPSQTTGLTLTEMFELGYLRVIPVDWKTKFQGDVKAHNLAWRSKEVTCDPHDCCGKSHIVWRWLCIKCGFETKKVSDLRKNKGCHMFACHDTERIK